MLITSWDFSFSSTWLLFLLMSFLLVWCQLRQNQKTEGVEDRIWRDKGPWRLPLSVFFEVLFREISLMTHLLGDTPLRDICKDRSESESLFRRVTSPPSPPSPSPSPLSRKIVKKRNWRNGCLSGWRPSRSTVLLSPSSEPIYRSHDPFLQEPSFLLTPPSVSPPSSSFPMI